MSEQMKERERIISLLNDRAEYISEIAKSMGEPNDVSEWSGYVQGSFLEVSRLIEVISGELPVRGVAR